MGGTALVLALLLLFLTSWIFLPAPTYFLLTFGVGAPEVSAWLLVGSLVAIALVAIALALVGARRSIASRVALGCAAVALCLAATSFIRLPATIARFDADTRRMSAEPKDPVLASPVVITDLFRGIPIGDGRLSRGVPVTTTDGVALTGRARNSSCITRNVFWRGRCDDLRPFVVMDAR